MTSVTFVQNGMRVGKGRASANSTPAEARWPELPCGVRSLAGPGHNIVNIPKTGTLSNRKAAGVQLARLEQCWAAMRRASSRVSSLAAARLPGSSSK